MKRTLGTAAALAALAGCSSAGRSGGQVKTEVMIPSTNHAAVVDIVTRGMMSRGWQVRQVEQKSALFSKPAGSLPSDADDQTRVDFRDVDGGVRVVATCASADVAGVDGILTLVKSRVMRGPRTPPISATSAPATGSAASRAARGAGPAPGAPRAAPAAAADSGSDDDTPEIKKDRSADMIREMQKRALGQGNP